MRCFWLFLTNVLGTILTPYCKLYPSVT